MLPTLHSLLVPRVVAKRTKLVWIITGFSVPRSPTPTFLLRLVIICSFKHWKQKIVNLTTLSSLPAYVVITTTCGATRDDKGVKLTTFRFQWTHKKWSCLYWENIYNSLAWNRVEKNPANYDRWYQERETETWHAWSTWSNNRRITTTVKHKKGLKDV